MKEIRFEIDEGSLKWGDGHLGEVLKQRLLEKKVFDEVHYPIFPSHSVPTKLRIVVQGDKEEDSTGFLKAFFTGLLFFIPVGIIQYEDIFTLTADMWLTQGEQHLGPINIKSEIEADHTLFSKAERYTVQVREQGFLDLADRIILELRNHAHWFSNGK